LREPLFILENLARTAAHRFISTRSVSCPQKHAKLAISFISFKCLWYW